MIHHKPFLVTEKDNTGKYGRLLGTLYSTTTDENLNEYIEKHWGKKKGTMEVFGRAVSLPSHEEKL